MKSFLTTFLFSILLLYPLGASAQTEKTDAFNPIVKYIAKGDAESLSAWFADNLDISVLSRGDMASRNQAKQVMKNFFESHTPRSFQLTHTSGRANMKYALGNLNAGGENFLVTIFVSSDGNSYRIQQLKIERRQ